MLPPALVRGLSLFFPVLLLWLAWRCAQPDRRMACGALLATVWQLPALLLVQEANRVAGWWHFEADGGLLHEMPADLWLGWAVLWGAVPALALRKLPALAVIALMAALDAVLMPLCEPVVQLQPHWWAGELTAVAVSLLPAVFFARWTAQGTRLRARVLLQFIAFSGLMLWVIPCIVLEQTGDSWQTARGHHWTMQAVLMSLAAFFAVPALSAVQEFCQRGQGTPVPLDPPRRLVTSGPYAYLANPMQCGMTLVFVVWGFWTGSFWVGLVAVTAVATCTGIAGWNESNDLRALWRYLGGVSPRSPQLASALPSAHPGAGAALRCAVVPAVPFTRRVAPTSGSRGPRNSPRRGTSLARPGAPHLRSPRVVRERHPRAGPRPGAHQFRLGVGRLDHAPAGAGRCHPGHR